VPTESGKAATAQLVHLLNSLDATFGARLAEGTVFVYSYDTFAGEGTALIFQTVPFVAKGLLGESKTVPSAEKVPQLESNRALLAA
jgi:hypothetical protein